MHVRVCPDCGEEFRPEIVRCSDCGAVLVDPHESQTGGQAPNIAAPEAPEPGGDDSLEDHHLVFSSTSSEALRGAADALVAAGIAFRITHRGAALELLVHADDYAAAAPALTGRDGALVVDTQPDAPEEQHVKACPACGTSLAADAVECPECELVVGGNDDPTLKGGLRDDE